MGVGEMIVSNPNIMASSLNPELHRILSQHKAFSKVTYDESRLVKTTTMDALIREFGLPSFAKIDVEGYEPEVFKGLSKQIPALSFEFIPIYIDSALRSMDELRKLGPMMCNYAIAEQFRRRLNRWVDADEMALILESLRDSRDFLYGDVYVRYIS